MSNNLYFIPILAHALEQPDTPRALAEAFEQIRTIGRAPEYRQGFLQFKAFMYAARGRAEAHRGITPSANSLDIIEKAVEFAFEVLQGADAKHGFALATSQRGPADQDVYEAVYDTLRETMQSGPATELVLEREGKAFAAIALGSRTNSVCVRNVHPGAFRIRLNTGLVLWENIFTAEDLLWIHAHPDEPLDLAADSGQEAPTGPAKEITLLNGEIVIRTFPGIEGGRLEVAVKTASQAD